MSISILKPGVQTTIQDIGRYGYSHFGISSSGAADLFSFRLGNIIVGNPEELAGIEMTLLGADFQFNSDAVIAITGSPFNLSLDSQEIPYNQSIYVKKNQILSVGITKGGARSYLLVKGGIKTENYLNSKTTHVMSGMGGFMGRPLKKGDILEIDKNNKINITNIPNNLDEINTSKMFTVSEVFSRMGIRLKGNPIHSSKGNEILTEGIPLGAIQVPGGGEPIISFVEHQTTGGYPKIANVISADLCKVGQLKPGDKFQFELISFEDAEILRLEQEAIFNN